MLHLTARSDGVSPVAGIIQSSRGHTMLETRSAGAGGDPFFFPAMGMMRLIGGRIVNGCITFNGGSGILVIMMTVQDPINQARLLFAARRFVVVVVLLGFFVGVFRFLVMLLLNFLGVFVIVFVRGHAHCTGTQSRIAAGMVFMTGGRGGKWPGDAARDGVLMA